MAQKVELSTVGQRMQLGANLANIVINNTLFYEFLNYFFYSVLYLLFGCVLYG